MLRTVVEQPAVMQKVDDAREKWPRANDAWNAITWVVIRDPGIGVALTESGKTRTFVLNGARSIGLPTVTVVYEVEPTIVVIHDVLFEDSTYAQAGTA
jgi:hypothetical protein